MTKVAQLKQQPLSASEQHLLQIIEEYERNKMKGLSLEDFIRNYAEMFEEI
jgi:hypothetical protein